MRIQSCPITPPTLKMGVTDKIFDKEVRDDYRWLEKDQSARDEWLNDQVARTDCHLDAYPKHGAIKDRLLQAFKAQNKAYKGTLQQGDGCRFQWSRDEGAQYDRLTRFPGSSDKGDVIFDPGSWPKGETLGWSTTSPDKKFLAYGRVLNGMDVGQMEILDIATGEVVRKLEGTSSTLAPTWAGSDDKLYFSPRKDSNGFASYDVSEGAVKNLAPNSLAPYGEIAEHNGNVLFTTFAEKAYDEKALFVDATGALSETEIPTGQMSFSSHGTNVFIQTTADAPQGKVLMLDMSQTSGGAPVPKVVIPEEKGRKIDSVTALDNAVAISYSKNALPGLAVYDLEGNLVRDIPLDGPGSLSYVRSDSEGNLKYTWSTLAQPGITKSVNIETGETKVVGEHKIPNFNPADFTVERAWYTSDDGTKVPMTLAHKKGVELNGENPAHIYVYGGFRSGVEPQFSVARIPFLEAGGVYAIAHVRGGDELGDEWHDQATGLNRTKVYDDVAGAAKYLAEAGYSSAAHTSLEGASNGGLVTGVAITRNPELFDAAIAEVGLYDMTRYEELGGESWNQEYGSIKDEKEANGLLSWSPYQNVKNNVDYPAVLVTTGRHDDRVDPSHSFKFAAKLQEAQTSDRPVYLRVEDSLGHGHGATDEQWADRYADQWAFLLSELTDTDRRAHAA